MENLLKDWQGTKREVSIKSNDVRLNGDLNIPEKATSIVVFVHGSGSSRKSPRNQFVANFLNRSGFATLLFDLLIEEEELIDKQTANLRFDINLLAERVIAVTEWLTTNKETNTLKISYFGASTGAAASMVAASSKPGSISAIVSRGGRPDLTGPGLHQIQIPVLLIVGENDPDVLTLNQNALENLAGIKQLSIIPKASHLLEEAGTLEQVAELALNWFKSYS